MNEKWNDFVLCIAMLIAGTFGWIFVNIKLTVSNIQKIINRFERKVENELF